MKKIIISCAPAGTGAGSNLGMNTVDFAIENIVKENNLEDVVEINRPWNSYIPNSQGKLPSHGKNDFPLKNIVYNNFQLTDSKDLPKAVFFWGDFQHGLDFQTQTAKRLKQIAVKSQWDISLKEEDLLQSTKNYFLLNDYFINKKLPFKIAMYGVTLFQNGLNDYLNKEYLENLKWLYENAVFSKSRESYSANMISFLKEDYNNSFLGVDCALLNTKEELLNLPKLHPKEFNKFNNNVGVFFGRSTKSLSKLKLLKFINGLADKMKREVINIPWNFFSGGLFADNLGILTHGIKKYNNLKGADFTPGDIFQGMADLSLIVTDTYHVAVNAIALNIPVVCVYEPSPQQNRNANMGYRIAWRDKRALLFQTNNLSDFLVSSEDLKNSTIRDEKIENIISLINHKEYLNIAYSNLHSIAINDRKKISQVLKDLRDD